MKNSVQTLFILALVFLPSFSFGQIQAVKPAAPKTHLDFFISAVNTELNYGKANPSLKDFKKPAHRFPARYSSFLSFPPVWFCLFSKFRRPLPSPTRSDSRHKESMTVDIDLRLH